MASFFIIDRRLNPKGKSIANRQRFLRRTRAHIRDAVKKAVGERKIGESGQGESVNVPSKNVAEPRFHHASKGGDRTYVLPGNKEYSAGDRIPKPTGAAGEGGSRASDRGDGDDDFQFTLTREEFLDIFFDDLELPDLVKTSLKEIVSYKPQRAGLTSYGTATNLNLIRTMRMSHARRIALNRPSGTEVDGLLNRIFELEKTADSSPAARAELKILHEELDRLERRRKFIAYIDPMDLRYNYYKQKPAPTTQAVMFCLMDVSGSMTQHEKDLAKRFFMLLHLFLERRYGKIDVVFVRHTHEAKEVDEDTFFYSRETGGTVVSTALVEMLKIMNERYPAGEWNIYAAQASDGDNWSGDSAKCIEMLDQQLLPFCQYYAYVEILDEREMETFANEENGAELWRSYRTLREKWKNFATKRIARPSDIFPVFHDLFAKQSKRK
jgi:uncharacterized sporulation protein YeaH/YhbH (DUF444 family)